MGNGERDNALKDALKQSVWQVDPEGNPGYVMGPDDDVPRLATRDECVALGIKFDDVTSVTKGGKGHPIYKQLLAERLELHIEKSSGYGTDDDPFANFTAVARAKSQPRFVYPVDRVQEKLTRIYSLIAQGLFWKLEEEFKDCASLFDCATAMLREDSF